MFSEAYNEVRESTYALLGRTPNKAVSCGSAFAIAPGVLATVAHVLYQDAGDPSSFQNLIEVMRDPEINSGAGPERATVIAVDSRRDIGLIRVNAPRSNMSVRLSSPSLIRPTIPVGTIGYPLMKPNLILAREAVPLLRFQHGNISAVYELRNPSFADGVKYYETDMSMFKGSSGCPGFLRDGLVFGMHIAQWHEENEQGGPGQRAFSMWLPSDSIAAFAKQNGVQLPLAQ